MTAVSEYAQYALKSTDAPINMRQGQYAMNLLAVVRPDIYDAVAGTDDDPFYDDARLPDFYDEVQALW